MEITETSPLTLFSPTTPVSTVFLFDSRLRFCFLFFDSILGAGSLLFAWTSKDFLYSPSLPQKCRVGHISFPRQCEAAYPSLLYNMEVTDPPLPPRGNDARLTSQNHCRIKTSCCSHSFHALYQPLSFCSYFKSGPRNSALPPSYQSGRTPFFLLFAMKKLFRIRTLLAPHSRPCLHFQIQSLQPLSFFFV